jgi:L-iditol 2-dehydrogenase
VSHRPTTAAILTRPGQIEVNEMDLAAPGDGEVLIRVHAVGLCGSDAHWFEEGSIGDAGLGAGLVLGHEFSGVIDSGPRAGERVAVDPAIPCLVCEQCRRDRQNLCLDLRFAGHGITHGALRRHLVWPERCLVSMPDDMPDAVGALLEPLGVAIHAVDLASVDDTTTVGVIGSGPIGLLVILVLQSLGVTRIVATDPIARRLETAEAIGATVEPTPLADSSARFDVVFDAVGTDAALATALDVTRPGGLVVAVGIPPDDRNTLTASVARRKELTLRWSRRMDAGDLARAASLAAGRIDTLAGLVTHRYPLSEAAEAFDCLIERRGVKVLVTPGIEP